MRDVGRTNEGNFLVEMSELEHVQFCKLSKAVEGLSIPAFLSRNDFSFQTDFDFTKVFEVIRAWYSFKFRVNEFQALLNDVKGSLERTGIYENTNPLNREDRDD